MNAQATLCWCWVRKLTTKPPDSWTTGSSLEERCRQMSTSGGSSETEVKEFTVVPEASCPAPEVMTVTPVAKFPHTSRRARPSTGAGFLVVAD